MFIEHRKGLLAGRYLKASALSGNNVERTRGFIAGVASWKDQHRSLMEAAGANRALIELEAKSAVGATTLAGSGFVFNDLARSWFDVIRPLSAIARMDAAAKAPLYARLLLVGSGAVALSNIAEGVSFPLVKSSFTGATLQPVKTVAGIVVTKDFLRFANDGTEDHISSDLAAAVASAEDAAFLTPATTGSILHGATAVPSTGATLSTIDVDLKSAVAALVAAGSTLVSAVWIMSPTTATSLSLIRGSGGDLAYPDVGVRGGTLAGLPVFVTAGVAGFIALVDQAGIVLDQEPQIGLDSTEQAAVEMSDAPTDSSVTPTASNLVSLWQTDSVALRAVQFRAWALVRPGFATYISGVTY